MAATLVEQVYNQLLRITIGRELKPGGRPPSETVLCDQMEVSRNTLRATLNKLDALGLTVSRQGGGTYVREMDSDVYLNFFVPALLTHNANLLEVMQFRKGIEVETARLAAASTISGDIAELGELLEHCKESLDEMERFAQSNTDFHTAVTRASHNMMFKRMMEIVRMMILTGMQDFLVAQEEDVDNTFYHEMILRCIIEGKPEEAALFMKRHLTLVTKRVEKYVKKETKNNQVEEAGPWRKKRP